MWTDLVQTLHFKKVYRIRDKETGKAEADLICVHDEVLDTTQPLEIFDPVATWKRKTFDNYTATELLVPIFKNGELVYDIPALADVRAHCAKEIEGMWEEVRRFTNPHNYYVDLSEKLWQLKQDMLSSHRKVRNQK